MEVQEMAKKSCECRPLDQAFKVRVCKSRVVMLKVQLLEDDVVAVSSALCIGEALQESVLRENQGGTSVSSCPISAVNSEEQQYT